MAALELLVSSQTKTQEILQQSLSQETDRRLAMETLLLRTLDEDRLKLQQLESSLKVDHDRMVALESTLQQEISLREDAEMSGEDILLDLSKKISVMEGDLSVVSLLDSRARSLEEQSHLQMEEISSLQQQYHHTRRGEGAPHHLLQPSCFPVISNTHTHTRGLCPVIHQLRK